MAFADMDVSELVRRIVDLEMRDRRWAAERLELVAEFDRRNGHRETGFRSTAEWLAFTCRMDERTARDYVRVARRLGELPQVERAFHEGRLSYAQVRALTRAEATEDEGELLRVALRSTTAELERHVRQLRSSQAADVDVARAAHEKRGVKFFWHDDGSLRFFGQLGPTDGALLVEAIEAGAEAITGDPATGERRPSLRARQADALVALAAGNAARAQVVLHVDPEALACQARGEEPRAGDVCFLLDGPAIPSELARRLTCDADVSVAGLNLGRTTRTVTPVQRRALEARDGRRCTVPGCTRRHGLEAHHIRPWARGGRTDLENLTLVCRYHHRLFHDDGWSVRRHRDGTLQMEDPRGRPVFGVAARASPERVAA